MYASVTRLLSAVMMLSIGVLDLGDNVLCPIWLTCTQFSSCILAKQIYIFKRAFLKITLHEGLFVQHTVQGHVAIVLLGNVATF